MNYEPCHRNDEFVTLTSNEIAAATEAGKWVYRRSQERGLRDYRAFVRHGVNGERVQVVGAIAELATCKLLDLRWTKGAYDTFKRPDLPHNIEVRLIGVNHYGLRVYEGDDDSRRVVGVVIERGREHLPCRFPGWINAVYGKREEYLIDPLSRGRPVFAVPQWRLIHLDKLRELIEGEFARR